MSENHERPHRKVASLAAFLMIVMAGVVLLGVRSLTSVRDDFEAFAERDFPGFNHLIHVDRDLFRAHGALEAAFLTDDHERRVEALAEYESQVGRTAERWESYLVIAEGRTAELELQAQYDTYRAEWLSATSQLVVYGATGRSADDPEVREAFVEAQAAFDPLRAAVHDLEEEFYEPLIEHGMDVGRFDSRLLLLGLLAAGLGVGLVVSAAAVRMTKKQYLDLRRRDEVEAQRQMELKLNRRFRSLVESSQDVITVVSGVDRLALMSPNSDKLDAIGQVQSPASVAELLVPDDYAAWLESDRVMQETGEPCCLELRTVCRDGATLHLEAHGSPMVDDPGERVWVWRDVTEQREAQQRLLQSQKLESMGRLAAGIAHEINTPMQYIGDNTHFLNLSIEHLMQVATAAEAYLAENPEHADGAAAELAEKVAGSKLPVLRERAPDAAADAISGVDSVSEIVKAMKRFSHPGTEQKRPVDINDALATTITVCRNEWKYAADLETEFTQGLPLVEAHAGELNQVWLNLIVNAAHAIGDAHPDTKGTIRVSTAADDEGAIVIQIADNGTGIDPDDLSAIFDPFFTTKGVGQGTGQGLAIAHQIVVNEHHGTIGVESTPGEGTTFTITIPIVAPSPAEDAEDTEGATAA